MEQAFVVPVTRHWNIREAAAGDAPEWVAMRAALWPEAAATELARDVRNHFDLPRRAVAFLAFDAEGKAIGFAEATVRTDYVNGTDTSPVGFLEGWYVDPSRRSQGVGRALAAAVERWTRQRGCTELASDAWLADVPSQRAHVACGFEETERVVCFRKLLADAG
jgi:aminoglycoside 6'-N-acetyltransferase I